MNEGGAARVGTVARQLGITVGVAESLTGGLLSSALSRAEEASVWFRGGIVAYSPEVKRDLLGVSPGPVVTERCAAEMAAGALKALGADVAVAVTGVGGPEPEEDQRPGTVWAAISTPGLLATRHLQLDGDPADICRQTCEAVCGLLGDFLEAQP